ETNGNIRNGVDITGGGAYIGVLGRRRTKRSIPKINNSGAIVIPGSLGKKGQGAQEKNKCIKYLHARCWLKTGRKIAGKNHPVGTGFGWD
ncbi:MAG: hypothetical protein ABIO24_05395, partial [Saprospiraceae bacterium]